VAPPLQHEARIPIAIRQLDLDIDPGQRFLHAWMQVLR
jgi:hypothetical protein